MADEQTPIEQTSSDPTHIVELRVKYPNKKDDNFKWKKFLVEKVAAALLAVTAAWAGAYFVAEQTAQTKVQGLSDRLESSEVEALVFSRAEALYRQKVLDAMRKRASTAPVRSDAPVCPHCQGRDPGCEQCLGSSYGAEHHRNPVPLPVDDLKLIQSQVQEQLTEEALGKGAVRDKEAEVDRTKRVAEKLTKWTKTRGGPRAIERDAQRQLLDQNQERALWDAQAHEDDEDWDWDGQIQKQVQEQTDR